ncbi:MAG: TonB-dependent receptor, partial [Woeseiaceae bacterium]|nr:TonB-dependent receptor [Woeseiaceae bacterium]
MKFVGNTVFRAASVALVAGTFGTGTPVIAEAQDAEIDPFMIEEIVVRARKRDESLQTVPVAVSAVTAANIERLALKDFDEIAKITAGLSFDPDFQRSSNRPVIRGQATIQNDSGVSYFIDGVYITGSINDFDVNDVERIEVVKGPQSALYGRNTYSGAINIITKSPGEEYSARVRGLVTDDGTTEINATVKGPIGDSFGLGLTGRFYDNGGAFTNTFDGSDLGEEESMSLSAVASFDPTDNFSARARVYYAENEDGQPTLVLQPHAENNCLFDDEWDGGGRYYCGELAPRPLSSDWTRQVPNATNARDLLQASLTFDWNLGDAWTLTSVTGYNHEDEWMRTDADYSGTSYQNNVFARFPTGFPFPTTWGFVSGITDFTFSSNGEIEDVSQELRLRYQGERSEFLVGAYYFDQRDESFNDREHPAGAQAIADANFAADLADQQAWCAANFFICSAIIPIPPFPPPPTLAPNNRNYSRGDVNNIALFAMGAFELGDATRLTIEGRYAEEEKDSLLVNRDEDLNVTSSGSRNATFRSFSPRVTVDHRMSDDNMVYGLIAEGTKPGGFNSTIAVAAGLPTFEEEEVRSFEIGSKNTVLDGQGIVNFSVFFNEVSGIQLTETVTDGTNTGSATVNSGDAELFGFELETRWNPSAVEGLSLTMNYAFVDTEIVKGDDRNQGDLDDVADNGARDCSIGDV